MSKRKRRLTIKEATEFINRAVEEKGANHVVSRCLYFDELQTEGTPQPCCIVGQVLAYAGVTPDEVRDYEGMNAEFVVRELFPATSERVLNALDRAQGIQDSRIPWGEAQRGFEDELTRAA